MYVSMKEMLWHAHDNHYAVMAVNCINLEQVKACIESAEEENSAIIINISPRQMNLHGDGEMMANMVKVRAKRSLVPIAFNLDHGKSYEDIQNAIRIGFSSAMIDASGDIIIENVKKTKLICSIAPSNG